MPRRWLILTQDFPPAFVGGIASWAADLARALQAAGEETCVLARRTGDTAAHDARQPYPIIRMRGRSWGRWQGAWAALAAWPQLGPGTVVIAATWGLATGIAPRLRGARLGIAFHGSDLTRLAAAPPPLRRALAAAHALLPVSEFLGGELLRLDPGLDRAKIRRLPMPLAAPPPPAAPRGERLVFLGRLTPLKGVDRAVRLAEALGRPLEIVGGGPERARLEALAGPSVAFAGELPRDEALSRLEGAGAAVLLPRVDADGSGAEGLGLCLIEAALRGVPGIGCRTGGVPEAAGAGLVLEDPDRPDVAGIERFLADSGAGEAARAHALRTHGPERAVEALREMLA